MKAKQTLFCTAAILLATGLFIASCDDKTSITPSKRETANVSIYLNTPRTVSSAMLGTKASGDNHGNETKDKTIDTLQLFVFNEDNLIEAYDCFSGDQLTSNNKYTMTVTVGSKKVYAIANSHDSTAFASVKNLDELKKLTVSLSKENALDFSMKGNNTIDVKSDVTNALTIEMTRFVSRVHVGTVKTDFEGAYSGATLTGVELYLTNVYCKSNVSDMKGKSGSVINADTLVVSDFAGYKMDGIVYEKPGNITSAGVKYDKYFYCYSNPGSSKSTRLVIRALLDSIEYFYPIALSDSASTKALAANTAIDISSVTIKRPGSKDPSEDVTFEDVEFTITVNDWIAQTPQNIEF